MGISPVVLVSAVVGAIAAAVTAATTRRRIRERLLADLPTAPIPRPRDVYVGRAPVADGLPDYEAGYADGLARAPMRPSDPPYQPPSGLPEHPGYTV